MITFDFLKIFLKSIRIMPEILRKTYKINHHQIKIRVL